MSILIHKDSLAIKHEHSLGSKIVASMVCVIAGVILAACANSVENQSAVVSSMQSGTNAPQSFFGNDLSLLRPGQKGQAAMIYVNPDANWKQYDKILLEPVQFRDDLDTKVPPSDQEVLTAYFYNQLKTELQKSFTLVDQGGPGVLQLEVALTNESAATPGLRTISVVVPQARLLKLGQSLATDSYAFAGAANAEMRATDSSSGHFLAGAIDKHADRMLSTAAPWQWGDAKNVMNYLADKIATRLLALRGRQQPPPSQ